MSEYWQDKINRLNLELLQKEARIMQLEAQLANGENNGKDSMVGEAPAAN